jgi:SPP1 family predicted phage head-tail adaptor
VVIETDVGTSRDAGGQRVEDWQPFARRWARKVPQSSREFYRLSHQRSDVSYVLLLRKDSKLDGLTKKMRVRKGSQILNIVGIDPDVRGERREIALQCIEAT